ncbi:MAG: MBL fold metallo-hydrolase [Pseudomonadota bacterium]
MQLDKTFTAKPGEIVPLTPLVRRVTAPNAGPMTFTGTNTYLIGDDPIAVLDPGPDDLVHFDALLAAIGWSRVAAIVVTHTHRDHSPLARQLKQATGAPIIGAGPHRFARPPAKGDINLDAAIDRQHAPDQVLRHGQRIKLGSYALEAVATPGHTMNHMCFALHGVVQANTPAILFSGDHVMAWATTMIAPPDGHMTSYLESLQLLLERPQRLYLPAHGTIIGDAHSHVRALLDHRTKREQEILGLLQTDARTVSSLVDQLYDDLSPSLRLAAGLSVLAHLERLQALGKADAGLGPVPMWCFSG